MSYLYNGVPIIPGAYLVNGTSATLNELNQLPIFGSITNLAGMGFENEDNTYYVLPGYKLEIYNSTTLNQTINNTDGTKILYVSATTTNTADSIKMYYKNVELTSKYTYTTTYSYTNGKPSAPTTGLPNGSYQSTTFSVFPGAYLIDSGAHGTLPIFFSITNLTNFLASQTNNNEDMVLVMPGYKLILYRFDDFNNGGSDDYASIDNTSGTTIIVGSGWTVNTVSSLELFFNGKKILQSEIVL